MAVGLDGEAEVILTRDPDSHSMGYSIEWLPDGRLLTTGDAIRRQEPDGSMVTLAEQHANEVVVDGRGNVYINGADFNFVAGAAPRPGYIKLLTPDRLANGPRTGEILTLPVEVPGVGRP